MRTAVLNCARAALLSGPLVLAFFSGGYFDGPRVWAGMIAWALVAVAVLGARRPIPTSRSALLALSGMALLAVWTLVSFTWSPVPGTAYHDGQRVFLYLGVMIAAATLLGGRNVRPVEPAAAASALIVVGYGLSERLLPWLLHFHRSISAQGRLEQPLTYWNAMGAVAAIGLVLVAQLAGDGDRPDRIRIAAAAAAAPLGLGLYMSFSRGALFAGAAGLLALLVLDAQFSTLRGIVLALGAGVLATICAAPFSGVTLLAGSRQHRVAEGTVVLVLLLAIMLAAALIQRALCRREREERVRTDPLPLPNHPGMIVTAIVVAGFGLFLLIGAKENSTAPLATGATRLTSLQSNRYAYWRVAWRAFKAEPFHGVGGGGWATYWLRYRPIDAGASDAHSLYIQTLAELGLVGVALMAAMFGGVALAGRQAWRFAPRLASGLIAGLVVWACHVAVDWDWEMPAVTLQAVLLAGTLLALGELAPQPRGAGRR